MQRAAEMIANTEETWAFAVPSDASRPKWYTGFGG